MVNIAQHSRQQIFNLINVFNHLQVSHLMIQDCLLHVTSSLLCPYHLHVYLPLFVFFVSLFASVPCSLRFYLRLFHTLCQFIYLSAHIIFQIIYLKTLSIVFASAFAS